MLEVVRIGSWIPISPVISPVITSSVAHALDRGGLNVYIAYPDTDWGPALAGSMPIQTTPAITAVLNKTARIDLTSLTLWPQSLYAELIEKARRLGLSCDIIGTCFDVRKKEQDIEPPASMSLKCDHWTSVLT